MKNVRIFAFFNQVVSLQFENHIVNKHIADRVN